MRSRIYVGYKPGVPDTQSEDAQKTLGAGKNGIRSVRIKTYFEVAWESGVSDEEAAVRTEKLCREILVHPSGIEEYYFEVDP